MLDKGAGGGDQYLNEVCMCVYIGKEVGWWGGADDGMQWIVSAGQLGGKKSFRTAVADAFVNIYTSLI